VKEPIWYVKVTSKGQITLPKQIREAMIVREGDHLQATLDNDSIILTRREPYSDSEHLRMYMAGQLRDAGVDPATDDPELRAPRVRASIPPVNADVTARIRSQRESRDEVLS